MLKREDVADLVVAIHKKTGCRDIVVVGSAALVTTAKGLPGDLMMTPDVDLYARDAPDADDFETFVQIHFGQGSVFDETWSYYADAVSATTAEMPKDWTDRAIIVPVGGSDGLTITCPSHNDLARSWRSGRQAEGRWTPGGRKGGTPKGDEGGWEWVAVLVKPDRSTPED